VRELFEECDVLLSDKQAKLDTYEKQYLNRFPQFLKEHSSPPKIESLFAFCRLGTPIGLP